MDDTPFKDTFVDLFDALDKIVLVSFQQDRVNAVITLGNHLFNLAAHPVFNVEAKSEHVG